MDDLTDKILHFRFVDIDMIAGDAGLSSIHEFAEHDAPGCHGNIGAFIDNGWRLAAQFESDGHEIFRSRFHADPAYCRRTGIENIVEWLSEQSLVLLSSSFDKRDIGSGKILFDQFLDDGCRMDRIIAWLEHDRISGCHRFDQRLEGEQERIVPWRYDQHASIRIMHDLAF